MLLFLAAVAQGMPASEASRVFAQLGSCQFSHDVFPSNVALGQWARWRTRSACSREQREMSHSLSVSSWEAAQVHSCAPTGRRSEAPVTVLSREVEWHWMDTTQRALRLHAYARAVLTY